MSKDLDFEGLASALLSQCVSLLHEWLPGGRLLGPEFVCSDLGGGEGGSFSVNTRTGKWADFASDAKGGDLISLYAAIHQLKQGDAARKLASLIGYRLGEQRATVSPPKALPILTGAPPKGTPPPEMTSASHGAPSVVWCYRDGDGEVLFYVARYDFHNNKKGKPDKELRPFSWSLLENRWIRKSLEAPRPLYGLELLKQRPTHPIMLVEGEKAAEAARLIAGNVYIVMTWPNGGKSASKANWEPIYGRKVLIWPDADSAGMQAAIEISGLLVMRCEEVKIIEVATDGNGWDAHDALTEGWGWPQFKEWAVPRLRVVKKPGSDVEPEILPPEPPPPEEGDDTVQAQTQSVFRLWQELRLALSSQGAAICNADNVLRIFENWRGFKKFIWFDEFHQKYLTAWNIRRFDFKAGEVRDWEDEDSISLMIFLQREFGLSRLSREMVHQAVIAFAKQDIRNEPLDWLNSLTWDGVSRIDAFFPSYFGSPSNAYSLAASKNWWVSMAARLYKPGCQVDNMVVMEGGQGKFKSTALGIIGGKFYTEMQEPVTSKDYFMALQGKFVIEISELDAFSRAETNTIKRVISNRIDRFRPPYGRTTTDFPRQCVFVGTTNDEGYLKDHTGARRFWPIKVGAIAVDQLRADRDQLFAEAVFKYKAGEQWFEMPDEETRSEQESRREADAWEDTIEAYLHLRESVTLTEIATASQCLNIETPRMNGSEMRRIRRVLTVLGWVRKQHKELSPNGKQRVSRVWVPGPRV